MGDALKQSGSERTLILIPAFKAGRTIGEVVKRIRHQGFSHILVVDDGSPLTEERKTAKEAEDAGAIVVRHCFNRGYGAALRTGYLYAINHSFDSVVTLDADGQHLPEEIVTVLKPLLQHQADIVLGSRFLGQAVNIPWHRKLFLKGGILITYLFYGMYLTDSHNGFRAMSRRALQVMKFDQDRMAHSSEYPAEISRTKLKFVEVPVTVRYTNESLSHGQRTLHAFRILYHMIWSKLLK